PPPTSSVAPTVAVPLPAAAPEEAPEQTSAPTPAETPDDAAGEVSEATAERSAEPPTDVQPAVEPDAPTPVTDLPTEAGMPVFHDDDEVDWLRARADRPEPPPPLEDLPPKPLFAPDPPAGEPVRRPRAGSRAASASPEYWPGDASQDSGVRPAGRDTGSWGSGSWSEDRWGTGDGLDDTGDQVPGRSWFRLAIIVGVCVLVMVAAVAAYQLGLKPPVPGISEDPTRSSPTPTVAAPTPFTGLTATDFDPQGSPPREENPDQVPNVLDGDPSTAWTTSSYLQNFGPGGLKTGVGLIIDLGATKGVRQVVVTTEGGQTSLAAYVTSTAPTGIAGLTPVGTASGTGPLTITLDEAVSGQYVTVWLTLLPPAGSEFRGAISEVQVLG
ncbi:MAG TPA: discoidin domain-containing protein, partial [Nocardioides sp.]